MESFCTFFFTPFLELNLLLENNSVVRLLQTSSQAVPIGSSGGQHVNIYISLLHSGYVLTINTDLKI